MRKPKMRTRIGKQVAAGTQQHDNISGLPEDQDHSNVTVTNGWSEGLLIAPENEDDGVVGSDTHTSNLRASVTPRRRRRVKADFDPVDGNHLATIPNNVDPASDYIDESDENVQNAQEPAPITADLDDDNDGADDWDQEAQLPVNASSDDEEEETEVEDEEEEEITAAADPDAIDLIDVKDCDDTVRNLAFVVQSNKLLALKDNMVVASIGEKSAKAVGLQATYLKPQFQKALVAEAKRIGLRAALQGNGFVPLKVNLNASKLVAKRLETERQRIEASVQRTVQASRQSFDHSLAIATVGIQRGFFDVDTRLVASLEAELSQMGIKSPGRVVKQVFAKHGPQFIKAHFDMAAKLSELPQELRDQYVKSLDMISCDTQSEDSPIDPQQVTAAFTKPAVRASETEGKTRRDRNRLNASVIAQQILAGSKPLF